MKSSYAALAAVVCTAAFQAASGGGVVLITFDDGGLSDNDPVGNTYADLWARFPNGIGSDRFTGRPGVSGELMLWHDGLLSMPTPDDPIVIEFDRPLSRVDVSAIDVGFNDARLDCFDAAGVLVGWSIYEGLTPLGNELDQNDTAVLSVSASAIRRATLYQPVFEEFNDGTGFDDLRLTYAGCSLADVAEPFGTLDLTDVTAFAGAFVAGDRLADLNPDGLLDLQDVNAFVISFVAGCP